MHKKLFIPVDYKDFDITDMFACKMFFAHNYDEFDAVMHLAAYTNVANAEKERIKCFNINVNGTHNLLLQSMWYDKKFIYLSTDYVFDGNNGPYSEDDIPNPLNNYAKAKFETEKNILNSVSNYLILRITVVYGWEHLGKNFLWKT